MNIIKDSKDGAAFDPESFYVVPETVRIAGRERARRRNEQCMIAGMAWMEFRDREEQIRQQHRAGSKERSMRLGAALDAFREITDDCHAKVEALKAEELKLGPKALRDLGLDPDGLEHYRIDFETGLVLHYKGGAFSPLERGG